MSGTNWPAINPRAIADECSPAHIANVLTDAKAMIKHAAEALEAALPFVEMAADQDQEGAVAAMMLVRHQLALAKGQRP